LVAIGPADKAGFLLAGTTAATAWPTDHKLQKVSPGKSMPDLYAMNCASSSSNAKSRTSQHSRMILLSMVPSMIEP